MAFWRDDRKYRQPSSFLSDLPPRCYYAKKDDLTMVKRKWSLDLNQWLQNAPTRRSSRHASPQPVTEAIILDVNSRQLIRDNVVGVLARAPRGIWMRLLPLHEDTESIYFANGMDWDDVMPGMLHIGLVNSSKFNNKLFCPRGQCEGLVRLPE